MVRSNVLFVRLNRLNEYLALLRELQKCDLETFTHTPEKYLSTERLLHLCIKAINDIGNHIVAQNDLGSVEAYHDIPHILAEQGHLPVELRDIWIRMIGFRNILVHEYTKIDRQIVYEVLQSNLKDIEAIRHLFSKWI